MKGNDIKQEIMKTGDRHIKEIETLIGKFFDGETTLDEERRIYDFFKRQDVPQRLAGYREMFSDFAALPIANEAARPRRRTLWRVVASCAAVVMVAFGLWLYGDIQKERMLARTYEGSYVIENGRRTDNLSDIMPEIKAALRYADRVEKNVESMDPVGSAEADVLGSIDDPAERRRISEMLKD